MIGTALSARRQRRISVPESPGSIKSRITRSNGSSLGCFEVELLSRVRAILRRRELDRQGDTTVRRLGGLTIDIVQHEVAADGNPVALTPSEYNLLALLAGDPGRVFTRREIMQHLWQST